MSYSAPMTESLVHRRAPPPIQGAPLYGDVVLTTERLRLRRARLDDDAALHRIMSDPDVMRFWSTPPHETLDQTRSWLAAMLEPMHADSDEFIVECEGIVIGKIGAWRPPEIGFFIARTHWARGLASEAMTAFIEHGRTKGWPYLTADVDPDNSSCLTLLRRHGFVQTGEAKATWIVGSKVCDSVYLQLRL